MKGDGGDTRSSRQPQQKRRSRTEIFAGIAWPDRNVGSGGGHRRKLCRITLRHPVSKRTFGVL